jgi:hypothetical protein
MGGREGAVETRRRDGDIIWPEKSEQEGGFSTAYRRKA